MFNYCILIEYVNVYRQFMSKYGKMEKNQYQLKNCFYENFIGTLSVINSIKLMFCMQDGIPKPSLAKHG